MKINKIALVTGGSSGIGREIAIQLAKDGICVVINYSKSIQKAKEVKKEIESLGGKALICKANIRNETEIREMFNFISKEFGKLDILVNNAGIYLPDYIETHEPSSWDQIMEINLKAKFLCIKYAVPLLKKTSSPRIINISSRAAISPIEESVAYCCAATGIIMLTKVSALELSKYNIKVNAISPGLTKTPMTEKTDTEDDFNDYAIKNPSKRLGTPLDIANTVKFLTSEDADFINGENINVSGGILLV